MTTTIEAAATPNDSDEVEPEFRWLNVADLEPHPDNPRSSIGDLSELTRSVRARGILQPLLVLPANDEGIYLIAAGVRRHAAARKAGLTELPAVVRPMTAIDVIEAGLSENGNRTDLTIGEEIAAIERLMSLDASWAGKLGKTPSSSQRRCSDMANHATPLHTSCSMVWTLSPPWYGWLVRWHSAWPRTTCTGRRRAHSAGPISPPSSPAAGRPTTTPPH